jgi:hypothetical protein
MNTLVREITEPFLILETEASIKKGSVISLTSVFILIKIFFS